MENAWNFESGAKFAINPVEMKSIVRSTVTVTQCDALSRCQDRGSWRHAHPRRLLCNANGNELITDM
jgi:hypothetical protein